jgi:EmrB/QacA subfamily drug resistance transporter
VKNAEQSVPVGRTMTILIVASLAYALGQTAVVPAIGELARNLNTSPQNVTWTLTGYLVSAAVLTPVVGRLGDMFGKRRLLVAALVLFAAGGAVAALGGNLALVVTGRVIMGAGGGIFPLCFGIIRDEFPAGRRVGAMGLVSAVAGIGGGGGLLLGGVLIDHTSYRWIFWSGTLMALIAAVAAQLVVPESPERTPGRIDLIGAGLLAVGVTLPLLAISRAGVWGWSSPRTISMIVAGLLVLVVFGFAERRIREPLVDMRVLANPTVLVTNVATVLVGFGMFGAFMLIPQLIEVPEGAGYGFGGSATEAGLIMLPGSLTMLVAGPLSAMLTNRFGAKLPLALGAVITGAALVALAADHGSVGSVLGLSAVMFFGIGLSFAAIPNLIIDSVSPAQTGQATGVNTLLRSVGSSVGTQVVAGVLASSVVAGRVIPTEHAYVEAFLIAAGVTLASAFAAALIPRGKGTGALPVLEEIGAAAPLGEPALAFDRD